MENINRASTKDSPEVKFDQDSLTLSIVGNTYPENCSDLYEPIFNFLDSYELENNSVLNLKFHFNFINSTSTVYVAQLIKKVAVLVGKGLSTNIEWYYDELDEDLLDLGEKLASISKLEITFIPVPDED